MTIEEKIRKTFPEEPVMVFVAGAETTGSTKINCKAKNPTSSASGCFQIIKSSWEWQKCTGDVFNEDDNLACARKLYDNGGLKHWEESKDGPSGWGKYLP